MEINETSGVWGMNLEPGPEPDFKFYGSKPLDIASSTNSLSRGDEIKGFQTNIIKDKYFDEFPDKPQKVKKVKKIKVKRYPKDDLSMIIHFKEFINEGHQDIGGSFGTMGFQPNSNGMPNPPGEITSALFGQGEYVAGSITSMIEDPYFAGVERKSPPKRSKRQTKKYKNRGDKIDKIMNFKEYIKD